MTLPKSTPVSHTANGLSANPTLDLVVHFSFNGFQYRTDGTHVEGRDGSTWNRTGSIPVVLAAREVFETFQRQSAYASALSVLAGDPFAQLCPVWHDDFNLARQISKAEIDYLYQELTK
jgi:hypothetical protein